MRTQTCKTYGATSAPPRPAPVAPPEAGGPAPAPAHRSLASRILGALHLPHRGRPAQDRFERAADPAELVPLPARTPAQANVLDVWNEREGAPRFETHVGKLAALDPAALLAQVETGELEIEAQMRPGLFDLPIDKQHPERRLELEVQPNTRVRVHVGLAPDPAREGHPLRLHGVRLDLPRGLTITNPLVLANLGTGPAIERAAGEAVAVRLDGVTVADDGAVTPRITLRFARHLGPAVERDLEDVQGALGGALQRAQAQPAVRAVRIGAERALAAADQIPGVRPARVRLNSTAGTAGQLARSGTEVAASLTGIAVSAGIEAAANQFPELEDARRVVAGALHGEVEVPGLAGIIHLDMDATAALGGGARGRSDEGPSKGLGPRAERARSPEQVVDLFGLLRALGVMVKTGTFLLKARGKTDPLRAELEGASVEARPTPFQLEVGGPVAVSADGEVTAKSHASLLTDLVDVFADAKTRATLRPHAVKGEIAAKIRSKTSPHALGARPEAARGGAPGLAIDLVRRSRPEAPAPAGECPPDVTVRMPDRVSDGIETVYQQVIGTQQGDHARYHLPADSETEARARFKVDDRGARLKDGDVKTISAMNGGRIHGATMEILMGPGSESVLVARGLRLAGDEVSASRIVGAVHQTIAGGDLHLGRLTLDVRSDRHPYLDAGFEVTGGAEKPIEARADYSLTVAAEPRALGHDLPIGAQLHREGELVVNAEGVQVHPEVLRVRAFID